VLARGAPYRAAGVVECNWERKGTRPFGAAKKARFPTFPENGEGGETATSWDSGVVSARGAETKSFNRISSFVRVREEGKQAPTLVTIVRKFSGSTPQYQWGIETILSKRQLSLAKAEGGSVGSTNRQNTEGKRTNLASIPRFWEQWE